MRSNAATRIWSPGKGEGPRWPTLVRQIHWQDLRSAGSVAIHTPQRAYLSQLGHPEPQGHGQ